MATYNNSGSRATSNDKLWLLSCSEIWNNGYATGYYGYAKTKEGERYKYYVDNLKSTAYNVETDVTKKPTTSSAASWWLRSPEYRYNNTFCVVTIYGYCYGNSAETLKGIAPGFSI